MAKHTLFKSAHHQLDKTSPGRLEFQRGIARVNSQGEIEVTLMAQQGSHILSPFNQSNCFIVLEQNRGMVNAGELVDY